MKTILGTMTFSDQVDLEQSNAMIQLFRETGHLEVDTAYVYNKGKTETLLGEIQKTGGLEGLQLAGKANPAAFNLDAEGVTRQLDTSLERLNSDSIDLYYLHSPDLDVPITQTLEVINKHHSAGKFRRFGLSNYAAWQVAEIVELCERNGWVRPDVYQGMYNALTRDVERELFPCLANYGMAFYAYNPLAGGMLTGKHQSVDTAPESGRFATFNQYPERYWKKDYFGAIGDFVSCCQKESIAPAAAALRWLTHHSALSALAGEHGIILGASSTAHLEQNLQATNLQATKEGNEGALPQVIVDALDRGWEVVRPDCMKYFRP